MICIQKVLKFQSILKTNEIYLFINLYSNKNMKRFIAISFDLILGNFKYPYLKILTKSIYLIEAKKRHIIVNDKNENKFSN